MNGMTFHANGSIISAYSHSMISEQRNALIFKHDFFRGQRRQQARVSQQGSPEARIEEALLDRRFSKTFG